MCGRCLRSNTTERERPRALKEALHWSNADLLRYVKLKSIIAQPSDRMVVGVSAVEGQAPVAL